MFLSHTRRIVLGVVCLRLSVEALIRNYGKMPSARVLGVHVLIFTYIHRVYTLVGTAFSLDKTDEANKLHSLRTTFNWGEFKMKVELFS